MDSFQQSMLAWVHHRSHWKRLYDAVLPCGNKLGRSAYGCVIGTLCVVRAGWSYCFHCSSPPSAASYQPLRPWQQICSGNCSLLIQSKIPTTLWWSLTLNQNFFMLNRVIFTEAGVGGNYPGLQIWRECKLRRRQKVGWPTVGVLHPARVHPEDYMIIVRSFDGDLRKHPGSNTTEGMLGTRVLTRGPNQFSGVSLKSNGIPICSSSIRKGVNISNWDIQPWIHIVLSV